MCLANTCTKNRRAYRNNLVAYCVTDENTSDISRPDSDTFKKRVAAAAAALRSGQANESRRKTISFLDQASENGSTENVPMRVGKVKLPSDKKSTKSDLLTPLSENEEQMAASQRRLFDQMVTLRTRLNERLAASNKFAMFLESTLATRDKDIKHANERLVAALLEIESLKHIAIEAVEAAESESKTKEQVVARLDTLTKRLDLMHSALRRDVKNIDAACIKCVPIRWVGMASDIRIMGSFDNWTKGIAMSPEFIEGGNNVFVADLMLTTGTYEIKFVVDGIWQTAPEWATTGEGLGANNLIVVE